MVAFPLYLIFRTRIRTAVVRGCVPSTGSGQRREESMFKECGTGSVRSKAVPGGTSLGADEMVKRDVL